MPRPVRTQYQDPLEIIWIHAARQCGMDVKRDPEVFAAWDGKGVLRIGTAETLDADDSLAQMILHELCHGLVAGPESWSQPDWGLDYDNPDHQIHEQACLRLQAALADEVEMRSFFASTTDFRNYFDQLPADPLHDKHDPAASLALAAMHRFDNGSWNVPVREALRRTREFARLVQGIAGNRSLWSV